VRDLVLRAGGTAAYADLRLALVERGGVLGPRQRIPVDLQRLIVEKDDAQDILLPERRCPHASDRRGQGVRDRRGEDPGAVDFRPDLTPREYVTLAGGPTTRAKVKNVFVTFRDGKSYAMADAPPLEPGAVVHSPGGRGEVVAGLPGDRPGGRVDHVGRDRALRHFQRAGREIAHVRSVLGLSEPPFDNSPNPKFFYLSPEHEEALVRLVYMVSHRKGCGMLTGEYGCGKTTLSRALIQRLEAERYEIGLLTNPSWNAVDFLREVLYQLGVETEEKHKPGFSIC